MAVEMTRVDSSRNMARYYAIDIQPDLLGGSALIRYWGRIGSQGQSKQIWCADAENALELAGKIERSKAARGYSRFCPGL